MHDENKVPKLCMDEQTRLGTIYQELTVNYQRSSDVLFQSDGEKLSARISENICGSLASCQILFEIILFYNLSASKSEFNDLRNAKESVAFFKLWHLER